MRGDLIEMNQPLLEPNIEEAGSQGKGGARWMVVIYNNETNTVDEVVEILMQATGCDEEEAHIEMWEAHHLGKSSVHFAARTECEDIASVIASIGVRAEVTPEWED